MVFRETDMIHTDLLQILRCPMDPARATPLVEEGDKLLCPRCGIKFAVRDGIPVLVVEEAELPAGCTNLNQLPPRHSSSS
jgi:uncharacterized protein YbaR (Trm112 family)